MEFADRAIEAVECHPSVQRVRLVGSRATATATTLSDWDFAIDTDDFQAVARDIGSLLGPLQPIVQQGDPLSETWCWMVMIPGPTKVDFIFAEPHDREPPWQPRRDNLVAIDCHFWDWTLWLRSKRASGNVELFGSELDKLFVYILDPMGVEFRPESLDQAVASYLAARERLEKRFGVPVPRFLEHEVVRALHETA
jgi:hypothetical protein